MSEPMFAADFSGIRADSLERRQSDTDLDDPLTVWCRRPREAGEGNDRDTTFAPAGGGQGLMVIYENSISFRVRDTSASLIAQDAAM